MKVFTRLEESVVQKLVYHISQNTEVSLTTLAEECYVSKSTVIKTVKKLGYQGFNDLSHSIRFNAQASKGVLLPRVLVQNAETDVIKALAQRFVQCEGKRNFVFSADQRTGAILATYMSRKLAMFDIFAPPSYDYAMARRELLDCGCAFFFFHRELPSRCTHGQVDGYGRGMLQSAREAGFQIVAFCDYDSKQLKDMCHLLVRVSDNESTAEDSYIPKVLMLFEKALSQYSQLRGDA